ncbi:Unconventional myosin-Ib [Microtus ochrogaster]|uniref:Unconventional myosin-Ib n=1 Tax=Microtus ochrogaster TaxID=79684 RepID=A0A8J6GI41_MICOH|nr:Unconventional myosin-Ib [Microtus ochrogaster]
MCASPRSVLSAPNDPPTNDPLMARTSVKLCAEALGPLCTAAAEQGPQNPAEQLTSERGITKALLCQMKHTDPSVTKIRTNAYSLREKAEQEKQPLLRLFHILADYAHVFCIYTPTCYCLFDLRMKALENSVALQDAAHTQHSAAPAGKLEELSDLSEASKLVMSYVAAVCGKGAEVNEVKEQLLQSNPVLEAFGNAKTVRNDNSSRFGKYMDIEFDFKGDPLGGVIRNYLLEKSRVVKQPRGERNFHVFYQLLSGASEELLQKLKLERDFSRYNYLSLDSAKVNGVDDAANFRTVRNAMQIVGFTDHETESVLEVVAAVLKLGNIEFKPESRVNGLDESKIKDKNELKEICELTSIDQLVLERAFSFRTVEAKQEKVSTTLNVAQAYYARDALAKNLYSRLFSWLVNRINESIKAQTKVRKKVMGVLDIYGFEIFEDNSFEQFIINYCNEKLQQIFIELTLKEEQEEYIREDIEWTHIEYFNNAIICDLIENNTNGILAMLDEECLRPGTVTDETFLEKLNQVCATHQHFESRMSKCSRFLNDTTLPHSCFRIQH